MIINNGISAIEHAEQQIVNFSIGRNIGSGTFSVVKTATHIHTKETVAFKILSQSKIDELKMTTERVWREIKNLRLCAGHPHILHIYDVYNRLSTGDDTTIVTEYAPGGTLHDHLSKQRSHRLSLGKARYLFQQIVSGLEYMHHHGIAHRDITLNNLLMDLDRTSVKLADLGFSRMVPEEDGGRMITSCGSPNYAAPELLNGALYDGLAVDVWSLGVVLYVMLNGSMPFDEPEIPDLFKKIRGGTYNLPKLLSRDAKKLIPKMLHIDATARIIVSGIRKSNFYQKHVSTYLDCSPEVMANSWKSYTSNVDIELVDQLLGCYTESQTHQAVQVSGNSGEELERVRITRDLVEHALNNQDDHDGEEPSEVIRDLQLNYNILQYKKI